MNEENLNVEQPEVFDSPTDNNEENVTYNIDDQFNVTEVKEEQPSQVTIPVKFNHETQMLSIEEATTFAQKGMQSEKIMEKLRFLAAANKCGVGQLVENLIKSDSESAKENFLLKTNGDEALTENLLKLRNEQLCRESGDIPDIKTEEKQALHQRISDEVYELISENVGVNSLDDIPDQVLKSSAENGTPLALEYFKYALNQMKKIENAKQDQAEAREATAGKLYDKHNSGSTPEIEAMYRGIWS